MTQSLLVSYSLAALLWQALLQSPLHDFWIVKLLNVVGAWLYLPIPFLLLLGALRGGGRAMTWMVLPVLLFGLEYGPLFAPNQPAPAGRSLRIMTSNVEAPNQNQAMLETIRSLNPDILAIQELSYWQARLLGDGLSATHPYQRLLPGERYEGIGLFSRYPIEEVLFEQQGSDLGGLQHVRLEVDGREFLLMNVHPWPPRLRLERFGRFPLPVDYDTSARDARIDTLVERLGAGPTTHVALGDFNLADREPRYQELTSRFKDAQREAGWGFGFTFPAEIGRRELTTISGLVRIDYIFYDPSLRARSVEVGRMPGSDHYYLVADLVLPDR